METFNQRFKKNKQQQLEKKVIKVTRLKSLANAEKNPEKVEKYKKRLYNLNSRIESLKALRLR
tara:strand:+ start:1632 stop:1820 length:189 start_codon:yes stop_codon:yes gene_type:complete